jgi:hypothetical protein
LAVFQLHKNSGIFSVVISQWERHRQIDMILDEKLYIHSG